MAGPTQHAQLEVKLADAILSAHYEFLSALRDPMLLQVVVLGLFKSDLVFHDLGKDLLQLFLELLQSLLLQREVAIISTIVDRGGSSEPNHTAFVAL